MIQRIRINDDPVLRQKCEKAELPLSPAALINLHDMEDTLRNSSGVGLAAPQIGWSKCVIVLKTQNHAPMVGVEDDEIRLVVLINPRIALKRGKRFVVEGCLSLPGRSFMVLRSKIITVNGRNADGQQVVIKGTGLLAQILEHELDHLNGVLISDKGAEELLDGNA